MRITDPAGRGGQAFRNVAGALPASELVTVAQDYSVADDVGTVLAQTMRGAVTVTLPRAATCGGRAITVRKTDNGQDVVTVRAMNGEMVGGATSVVLDTAQESVKLQSDGVEWVTA